jgi:hypothetical protein
MDSCNSAIDVKEGTNMCSYKSLQLFYKLAQQLVFSSIIFKQSRPTLHSLIYVSN